MTTYTLDQLHRMDEYEYNDMLVETVSMVSEKDLYLDKLNNGQFTISYIAEIQAVFNSLDAAKVYWNRITA